jgi:hypothetical protein
LNANLETAIATHLDEAELPEPVEDEESSREGV